MTTTTFLTMKNIMEKGYFPAEIIPEFSTKSFADNLDSINFSIHGNKASKSVKYTIPRVSHSRRNLDIPNPFHQFKLSAEIISNWNDISTFIDQSTLSLTKPVIKESGKRALNRENALKDRVKYKIHNSIGKGYVLKTDISRYYSTIYTHSIPWAIHGKTIAKSNRGRSLYGNNLDTAVRNTQDQQTNGIPIGPDTSLVLSEIIGTAIDVELQNSIPNIRGTRYIDDYEMYFDNESEAREAYSKLERIVKGFQLDLNPTKFALLSIPDSIEPEWVSEMKLYRLRDTNPIEQYYDLISYFNKAFLNSKKYPNDAVLKYCIKRLSEEKIFNENWDIYESFLLNIAAIDSSTLPLVKILFNTYEWHYNYDINEEKISAFVHQFILKNIRSKNNFEVSWALSFVKSMGLVIDDNLASELFNFEDPISSVILLDLLDLGIFQSQPDLQRINSLLKQEELYGENWLLAYQGAIRNPHLYRYVTQDSFFSQLYSKSVSFYDPTLEDIRRAIYESDKEDEIKAILQQAYENDNGY
ncbi:TPA: RNA-directed DNA polymerase [Bacillus thuringiensis]|uniref:RNA-directed DNA polymerase n=1 Tax=Bacillus cereus TaxID=1396 RepID=UPI0011231A11|nr:RNA-directed DNA polymerase [Bacillus cereus]UDW03745.1 RNA-directed DNA polymerase [Bacillus cereus]